jgi:haloalkane dehalogenase
VTIKRAYCDLGPEIGGGQLHYRSNFNKSAPVLLLLHQSPSDSAMYETLMAELDDEFWLIAPDNPGFGQSDSLPTGFSLESCAAAVESLLKELQITTCFVFGHHTGASIAVQFVTDASVQVPRLALCGPTLLSPQMQASLPEKAQPFQMDEGGSHLVGMWERIRGKETGASFELSQREVMSAFAAGENYLQAYVAVTEQDYAAQLRALDCPTLVFAGTEDILYPQLAASADLLQQGTLKIMKGAGSYVCDRQAPEVAELLRDFFL